jgi:hypothetical protein
MNGMRNWTKLIGGESVDLEINRDIYVMIFAILIQ